MKKIEVGVFSQFVYLEAEKLAVLAARLTQRGEKIDSLSALKDLYRRPYDDQLVKDLCALPHPTLQKFGTVTLGIVGASRRFLAQITRHQNEVKFMSGSLQYSDYSGKAQFTVPYEITQLDKAEENDLIDNPNCKLPADYMFNRHTNEFLEQCEEDLREYEEWAALVGRDAAGYKMPQALRNVLIICATPYQWKHMISQRICRRNSLETRYVLGLCWQKLVDLGVMFNDCFTPCMTYPYVCYEGEKSCRRVLDYTSPKAYLKGEFPLI